MTELTVTESHVQTAVSEGLDRTVVQCRDVSGLANTTYIAECERGDDLVIAFCHDSELEADFETEPQVMNYVDDQTSLPIESPLYEDFSKTQLPCPFYITERTEGYDPNLRFKYLPTETRRSLLRELGGHLADLHQQMSLDDFGPLKQTDSVEIDPVADWKTMFHQILDRQLDGMHDGPFEHVTGKIESTVEQHDELLERNFDPMLLHHDLRPANTIIEDKSVNAIIDWERALAGHSEFDLFEAERNYVDVEFGADRIKTPMRQSLFAGYLDETSLRDGWRSRRALYRLCYLAETMRFYPMIPDAKLDASEDEMLDELAYRIDALDRLDSPTVLT